MRSWIVSLPYWLRIILVPAIFGIVPIGILLMIGLPFATALVLWLAASILGAGILVLDKRLHRS